MKSSWKWLAVTCVIGIALGSLVSWMILKSGSKQRNLQNVQRRTAFKGNTAVMTPTRTQSQEVLRQRLRVGGLMTTNAPINSARTVAWKPYRNFGPFFFKSPKVLVNGTSASFLHENFFSGNPDTAIYQKYYGLPLPTTPLTVPPSTAGVFPTSDGANNILLELQRLRYSSRYGGSFEILFQSVEDFQGEIARGSTVWDLRSLQMRAYVIPNASLFNPNTPLSSVAPGVIQIEFRPQGITAYRRSGVDFIPFADGQESDLNAELQTIATSIEAANTSLFQIALQRFAYGYVHTEFHNEIGATETVDRFELTDGFFDPTTSASEGVFWITARVDDIHLDTEPGDEEIQIQITAEHEFFVGTMDNPVVAHDFEEINDRGSTPPATLGMFRLDQCPPTIGLTVDVRENDDPFIQDQFDLVFESL